MARLAKQVDKFVEDHKSDRMAAFVVVLAKNDEASRKKAADYAEANGLETALTIATEGPDGPSSYNLNADVPITVIVSRRKKVEANFALPPEAPKDAEAQKAEVDQVISAAEKMFAK